jgi:hypothetical protein
MILGQKVRVEKLVGDDLSPNELACAMRIDDAMRTVLYAHPWSFATCISNVSCVPFMGGIDSFNYRFKKPVDAMRVQDVEGYRAFNVAGEWVYTRVPVRSVRYLRYIDDLDAWDRQVYGVLVRRLAADLAIPVTGGTNLVQFVEQMYLQALGDAKRFDSGEGRDFDYAGIDPISLSMITGIPRYDGGYAEHLMRDGDTLWN